MKKFLIPVVVLLLGAGVFVGIRGWNTYKGLWFANKLSGKPVPVIQGSQASEGNRTNLPLEIPEGYTLSLYAQNITNPRVLVPDSRGTILASLTSPGKVVAIVDGNAVDVLTGLNKPHGLAFDGNTLYVAETDQVAMCDYNPQTHKAVNKRNIIDLPAGGMHFTRSLLVKDGKLYVATGSDCNACAEQDPRRAAIWVSDLDGKNFRPFAMGLRNSVFLTVKPTTNEIWATNMGRDFLGDNLPPETVNIINDNSHYGWPYCYGNRVVDTETNPNGKIFDCTKMTLPEISMQAHSAPLGLAFLGDDLLVAYHGSWNRSVPTGYKIVKFHNGIEEDFVSGWLRPNGDVLGRPAGLLVQGNDVYIADDKAGVIYLLKRL